ncbi:MAG: tetratricopeptide repeat protein [Thermoanaerobaculales bacterium]|jgi:predicted Zn-dependent protease|nr:tetratricopeptide repeat protein [Thermoanaerobaculales bacterium]
MECRFNLGAVTAAVLLSAAASAFPASLPDGSEPDRGLPAGLAAFLEARLLEGEERYRDAMNAYELAFRADPNVLEVRIGYADLLLRLGMADRAVPLLAGVEGLDWHGRRVLALALAQSSSASPERMEEARQALEEVLDERDDDPNLQLAYGQLLHRMGRVAEAEAVIGGLRSSRPGSPQLISYHASLLLQLGRREEAAELFAECAAFPMVGDRCRGAAVDLLVELGRPGDAADVLLLGLADDDLDQLMRAAFLLWEANRSARSLEVVDRVLRQAPDSERARVLRAHLLSATGRHAEAIAELKPLVKKNPDDTELKLSLAWALARDGELVEARRWLDRAWEPVASDAGSSAALRCAVTAARIELVSGNPLLAREWLARVADPSAAGDDYVRLLGETYRREEAWNDGIGALVRLQPQLAGDARVTAEAIEAEFRIRVGDQRAWGRLRPLLDSDDPEVVLAGLQVLQGAGRWEDAEREAAAATARFPTDRDIRFAHAASLERSGRFVEAEGVFLDLLEEDRDDADAANYLGYMWAQRAIRLEEALDLVNRAVAFEPENPAFLDSLGWVHYRLGSIEQAEYWLRRAVELSSSDGTLLAHLGEVLVARGAIDEGSRFLRLALDLGCENPDEVRSLLDRLGDDATP